MNFTYSDELYHHGILGMKWGIRRYQNKDGSLTPAGRKKLNTYKEKELARANKKHAAIKEGTLKRYNKRVAKLHKVESKHGIDSSKYRKLTRKANRDYENIIKAREIANKEINAIKSMKYSDMQREKRLIGAQIAKSTLITLGTASLNAAGYIPFHVIYMTDADAYKTKIRVNRENKKLQHYDNFTYSDELYHHGILGMKWGVRRYQNKDGSLTPQGRKRKNIKESRSEKSSNSIYPKLSTEEKRTKLMNAKKYDRYELPFLESVQNTEFEYNDDKETRDREYQIYLDDRDDYIFNRSRTLKTV